MIGLKRRSRFAAPPSALERQVIPIASVMIASMAPLLPIVATTPLLPPFGFMTLVAWRLLRPELWPIWIAIPLGLFDDLFSGQPLGSAVALWSAAFLLLDAIEQQFLFRDYRRDWAIASCAIGAELVCALAFARVTGGDTSVIVLAPQWLFSVLLFPVVARVCAMLDRLRLGR